MRVLVAEDERRVADAVARGLRREGMAVDVAYDGATALDKARLNGYDVVVLDRDLPVLHGDEVCRTLRGEDHSSRVLMLTAASGTGDLVDGLSLGADDYMAKPFAFDELVARVWDENADPFTNSVRMTVLRLRRKLGDPPVIETVKGVGYRV